MKEFVLKFVCGLLVSAAITVTVARAEDTDDNDNDQEQAEALKKAQEELNRQQSAFSSMSRSLTGMRETPMSSIRNY